VYVVVLEGEFDMVNMPEVVARLEEAIADPAPRTVAIDLSAVTFLDSTLLQALVTARDNAQAVQKPVWLVRPAPVVWRVFQVTLLDELFRDFHSLAELEDYARLTADRLSATRLSA
jgi:anti-anti-sigma factor